jgi:hypothetical protein
MWGLGEISAEISIRNIFSSAPSGIMREWYVCINYYELNSSIKGILTAFIACWLYNK